MIKDKKVIRDILEQSEKFFHTKEDDEQIETTFEVVEKLQKIHPSSIVCRYDGNDLIGHVSILPTSKDLMNKFINKEINEKKLFELTIPQERYEAIYLLAAVVEPKYQKNGIATEMLLEAIKGVPLLKNPVLFYWPFTKSGEKLAQKVASILKMTLEGRKNIFE